MRTAPFLGAVTLIAVGVLPLARCSRADAPPPPAAAAPSPDALYSVKELMENIVDPEADFIFDSVSITINEQGATENRPTTDEQWMRVQRSAYILAEAANMLKMQRHMAPADDPTHKNPVDGPELPPLEIEKRVNRDRALWNKHADDLQAEAKKVLAIVKARDADQLYEAGSSLDVACENCHLEYWYPGDRDVLKRLAEQQRLQDQQKAQEKAGQP